MSIIRIMFPMTALCLFIGFLTHFYVSLTVYLVYLNPAWSIRPHVARLNMHTLSNVKSLEIFTSLQEILRIRQILYKLTTYYDPPNTWITTLYKNSIILSMGPPMLLGSRPSRFYKNILGLDNRSVCWIRPFRSLGKTTEYALVFSLFLIKTFRSKTFCQFIILW